MEHQASQPQVTGWKRDLVLFLDHQIYRLAKHWLLLFNLVIGIYVLLPIVAPFAAVSGHPMVSRVLYTVYRPACHQLPERSFFLFGPKATYTLDELWSVGAISEQDDIFGRQRFLGTPIVGFKMALCQRDMALYVALLIGGLLFGLLRRRLRPLKLWIFLVCLLPMAIDGLTQLLLLRESTWPLRLITGGLVGVSAVWLLYPHLEAAFADVRQQAAARL